MSKKKSGVRAKAGTREAKGSKAGGKSGVLKRLQKTAPSSRSAPDAYSLLSVAVVAAGASKKPHRAKKATAKQIRRGIEVSKERKSAVRSAIRKLEEAGRIKKRY